MRELLNKCFIFLFCTMNLIGQPVDISLISLLLLSVSVSALISYFDRERPLEYLCGGCLVLSLFLPELALFLPLFFYDCERSGKWYLRFAWVPLYLYHFHNFTLPAFFLFLFTGVLALYLSRLTMDYAGRFSVEMEYNADYDRMLQILEAGISKLESNQTGSIRLDLNPPILTLD